MMAQIFFQISKLINAFYTLTLCYLDKYGILNDLEINLLSIFSYYAHKLYIKDGQIFGV